jgi:hypothetical protein
MNIYIYSYLRYAIAICFAIFWFVLFFAGISHYTGSVLVYIGFSLASLLLFLSTLCGGCGFGYIFLSVFLWLGLWFKLTANLLIFGVFNFGEPVGSFDCSAKSWDGVLIIGLVACLGITAGRCLVALSNSSPTPVVPVAPAWYLRYRNTLWCLVVFATLASVVLNVNFGIHQIGLTPKTIWPWPSNALFTWFLNMGAAIFTTVLISWDIACGKRMSWQPFALLGQAFLTSVSIMSRAIFPLQGAAQAMALQSLASEQNYQIRYRFIWILSFVLLIFLSIYLVSFQRDSSFITTKALPYSGPSASTDAGVCSHKGSTPLVASFRLELAHQLLVNRWIGIEGVMAVYSYPGQSDALFWAMLKERREIGKATAYQSISNSGYQVADANFQFATLPGIAGFLFLSGSLWKVFIGTLIAAIGVVVSERIVLRMTSNSVLCSLYGMMVANNIAQFGVTPRQDIPQYLMFFLSVILLWYVQTARTSRYKRLSM